MSDKKALCMGLAGAISWSFLGMLTKLFSIDPWLAIGMRGFFSALLLALLRRSYKIPFTKGNALGAIGVGFTGILYTLAVRLTSAANAVALQYTMTAIVLTVTVIRARRWPTAKEVLTVSGVFVGVLLCTVQGMKTGGSGMLGNILAMMSAFTFSLVFLAGRRQDADPLAYTYFGNLLCIPLVLLAKDFTLPLSQVGVGFLVGLANVAGYTLLGLAMRKLSSVTAAVLANVEPVCNPIWVFLILGEWPGWFSVAGMLLVLMTIVWYQLTETKEAQRKIS